MEFDRGSKVLALDLCRRGIAVEKETANEREVFVISRDQVALWSLNRGMRGCLGGCGELSRRGCEEESVDSHVPYIIFKGLARLRTECQERPVVL